VLKLSTSYFNIWLPYLIPRYGINLSFCICELPRSKHTFVIHLWVPKNLKKTPIMHICEFLRWKKNLHYAYSQTLKMNIDLPFCIFVSSQDEQYPHYVYLWIPKMNIDPWFTYLWIPKMKTRPTYAYLWVGSKLGIKSHLLLKYFTRSLFKKNIS